MIETLPALLAGAVLVAAFSIIIGLLLMGFDRIVAARMQARIGPPLTQPFTDIRKLLAKENVVPENAIPWLFNLAPIIALASAITILFYLPIGGFAPVLSGGGDLILVMYLLTLPALALVAGGFASGSPYATVGAQREMVTMIAYEFPLAIVVVAIAWRLAAAGISLPFSLATIEANPVWGLVGPLGAIGLLILLIVLLIVTPAELSRVPFDTPEAETELAGGILVEYSGKNLALFSLTQGVKTVAMASLVVALFFPYRLAAIAGISGFAGAVIDLLVYIVLITLVAFISVSVIRVAMARFRINQVVSVYWIYLAIAGLAGLLLVMVDQIMGVV
ncbi:MAG TPA: NADH-quinone oxidoreductase subunit H [Methanoregulaceae archaeon]|jgi:formate hydrogenlyase subunit 4|nr:NADH-quinone oxidoreductase subunit H [Methanoregulaceae archaeon]MCC7468312.1 NADH-quinone oxidoreductase subunit H [Burkholderiaceae bacterium]NLH25955.1 NADH-quinone oxidoreductase subunit H [Methanomicrobiales archaeon]HNB02947.1 NADH-quinone oxidoreductase subunit H [Methanoregulaceae archaeon]HNJ79930.1 NADH-quinone oxidoreductase subunit H [Methanoregulaceae archaeon]